MPFPLIPLIGAGATIAGGVMGKNSAKKATQAQTQSLDRALALQDSQFQQSRQDLMPWLQTGGQAIGDLYAMTQPGYDHTTSPGYQFRLGEGLRGVENSAAARGLLQSGGTLKGIDRFSQDYAASDYGDQFNRLASIAAGGQQTGSTLGSLGAGYANAGSNILGQIGQARASGYAGQNQAVQGTLGNLFSLFSMGGFGGFGK